MSQPCGSAEATLKGGSAVAELPFCSKAKPRLKQNKQNTLVSIYEVQNGLCYGQPSTVAQTHTKLVLGQPTYRCPKKEKKNYLTSIGSFFIKRFSNFAFNFSR